MLQARTGCNALQSNNKTPAINSYSVQYSSLYTVLSLSPSPSGPMCTHSAIILELLPTVFGGTLELLPTVFGGTLELSPTVFGGPFLFFPTNLWNIVHEPRALSHSTHTNITVQFSINIIIEPEEALGTVSSIQKIQMVIS